MKKVPFFSAIFFIIVVAVVAGYVYVTTQQGSQIFYRTDTIESQNIQAQNNQNTPSRVLSSLSVPLLEYNESGEFGSAELIEQNRRAHILVVVAGEALASRMAGVYRGVCDELGDSIQQLSGLENGVSETVLEYSLEQLFLQQPFSIVVFDDTQAVVACGVAQ